VPASAGYQADIGAHSWVGIYFITSAEAGGPRQSGLLSGVSFAAIVVGLLLLAPLFGAVLEASDSYDAARGVFASLSAGDGGDGATGRRHPARVRAREGRSPLVLSRRSGAVSAWRAASVGCLTECPSSLRNLTLPQSVPFGGAVMLTSDFPRLPCADTGTPVAGNLLLTPAP